MDSIRISQCLIVKNEEANIERALSWGKGRLLEQIVVDTGSSDKTVDIAEKMGAKVYHYPWKDDFSAAKNYAIGLASGDWIAFLDADEYYEQPEVDKLFKILELIERKLPVGERPHMISSSMAHLDDEGRVFSISAQDRIFRNLPEVRYSGRIHEKLVCLNGPGLIRFDAAGELTIMHTGYAGKVYEKSGKLERNIRMLRAAVKEDPEDLDLLSYLGESLLNAGRNEEAEEAFMEVIGSGSGKLSESRMNAACYSVMKLILQRDNPEDEQKIWKIHKAGTAKDPGYPDTDYLLGIWLVYRKCWKEARYYLESALHKLETGEPRNIVYLGANLEEAYTMLVLVSQEMGDRPSLVKYCVLGLRVNRYKEELLLLLLEVLCQDSPGQENAAATLGMLKKLYDFQSLKHKLFLIKCAKMVGFASLSALLYGELTEGELQMLRS